MFVLIGLAVATSACTAAPVSVTQVAALCAVVADQAAPPMVGGYRVVATDDASVQAAAAFAAGELGGELGEVEAAAQQVVAGMNYRLTVSLEDGRKFNVVVYRALNGSYRLTSSSEIVEG